MANTFSRKLSRDVGNTATQIGTYQVPSGTTAVVIGLTVTNITGSAITANVFLNDQVANTRLLVNAPVSSGSSLIVVGGDQKLVLQAGDSIYVQGSAASSVDAVMSVMEIT
jgi:hypothetical protein